ncbi:MAG: prepilin peptidase [Euryarchaeota archaeon]|nr:prepilin peptidase [Euryarchaeota archaeon]
MFDVERTLIAGLLLAYACYADWRTRRVSNRVWLLMGAAGAALTILEFFGTNTALHPVLLRQALVSIGLMYPFAWLLWRMHAMGGADAKALMALALLYPTYPRMGPGLPLGTTPPFELFAFTLFGNSVLLSLTTILWMIALNHRLKNPRSLRGFVAVQMPVDDPRLQKQWRLLGDPVTGKSYVPGGTDLTPEYREKLLQKTGPQGRVWATPKLPFMLYITTGWAMALLYGDLLYQLTRIPLGR